MKYLNQLPLTAAFHHCDSARGSRGARLLRSLLLCPALVFLLAFFSLLTPPAYADDPAFTTQRPFGTGSDSTFSVAVGDMDGDGDLDIVAGNSGQQNVIYLNDGAGGFPNTSTYTRTFGTGSDDTRSVAVGDMDGDGHLDIVVGNGGQNVVYLNDGAGTFAVGHNFGTGSDNTKSVAVGDMDGDGALDIVVGNGGQNVVYLNDRAGRFPNTSTYTRTFGTGSDDTWSVAVGDLDGDEDLDIVVGNNDQQNVVYLNDGRGNFPITRTLATGSDSTLSVAVGDMDGDGDLDIVVSNYNHLNVVYLNDGAGNFAVGSNFGILGGLPVSVAVGDMDGDGDLDIVVGHYFGLPGEVYLNDGIGNFAVGPNFGGGLLHSMAVGDLDGDGDLDIVVGNVGQNVVYRNDGAGNFPVGRNFGTESGNTYSLAVGDLDSDGDLDIVVGSVGRQNVVCLNDGAGNFAVGSNFGTGSDVTRSVAVGDMDGDHDLDIVVGSQGHQNVVYLNNGAGNFLVGWNFGTGSDFTSSVAVGDLDGDGDLDIVAGNGVAVLVGSSDHQNVIYLNDREGNFVGRNFGTGLDNTFSVAVGDMDGDGDLDIVVGNQRRQSTVYLNDGAGNFAVGPNFGTGSDNTLSVAVGDMDGDGDLDIIVGNSGQQNVVYLNDGAGNFLVGRNFGTGSDFTSSVAVGDLDGDGDLDIVAVDGFGQNVVYLNDGAGNFPTGRNFTGSDDTHSVAVGDLDGDGGLDIVAGKSGQNVVYINTVGDAARLANNLPRAAVTRPGATRNADLYSTPQILDSQRIPITYTLSDPEGDPVRFIRAFYSPDGGGKWYTATAASGTITTDLPTSLGSAVKFDGVNDYINVPPSNSLNPLNELTMEAWVKLDDASRNQKIVGKTPMGSGYLLGVANNQIYPEIWDTNGALYVFTAGNIPSNQWTHLAVTWRSGGQMIGYINATPVMTITASVNSIAVNTNVLRIGASPWYGDYPVMGTIDDVRLYGRALSAVEIRAGMYQVLQGNETGLMAYWRFDEGTGAIIRDQTANHNDGTLVNGPTWVRGHVPAPVAYTYNWDTFASGFFGRSDDVVFRIEAYPSLRSGVNGVPLFQRPYASSTTFPFRVRGTQVRVLGDTVPIAVPITNALVYRLPEGQSRGAEPFVSGAGQPFHPDIYGYLQGRGELRIKDRLVALLPITHTDTYTLYYTSAAPSLTGLAAYTVTKSGVQTLTVSAANPLVLFNLDVSLEWDARNDAQFMSQLRYDLQRTSEFLYDWSNGQAALGQVTIHQDREKWNDAHIRIYATNRLRPNAAQGGIVSTVITDPLKSTITYAPGQVRMGAVWNRYGKPTGTLGEDWPRTLAHELGHYAFYLQDTYLGLQDGQIVPVDNCPGAMSDPYRDDYSEFFNEETYPATPITTTTWSTVCSTTLAARETGRWDWQTIKTFYPGLNSNAKNSGPSTLPLAVTQITVITPTLPVTDLLDVPIFNLADAATQGRYLPGARARAFLFRGGWATDLGRPTLDQVTARGAAEGDELCVYEFVTGLGDESRVGCEIIGSNNAQLALTPLSDWQPQVFVSPVTSRTIAISVTGLSDSFTPTLSAWLYPVNAPAGAAVSLTRTAGIYSGTFTLAAAAFEGYVRVSADGLTPRREVIASYAMGGNPGYEYSGGVPQRSGFGYEYSGGAPVLSADGQAILYGEDLHFPEGAFYTLQALPIVKNAPPWATVVGQAYRLSASAGAPPLTSTSLSLSYLSSEVPPGEEEWLRVYFSGDAGASWRPLPTKPNTYYNLTAVATQGPGLYVLMSSMEISLYGPGWNLFSYPVAISRSVPTALLSISGKYDQVISYQPEDRSDPYDPWKIYLPGAPDFVSDLRVLEFGRGYWIHITATLPITLSLWLKGASTAAQAGIENMPYPPATFYGSVLPGPGFTPTPGTLVTARVNGKACGQARTQLYEGQLVYAINVSADGPGSTAGCGAPGRAVTFEVGGRAMAMTAAWDNNSVRPLPLSTVSLRYLRFPLIETR